MHPDQQIDAPRRLIHSAWYVLVLVAAGISLLIFVLKKPTPPNRAKMHAGVGHTLAGFRVEPLANASKPVDLAQLRGKVTLVNFWGPWCPPCMAELPELLALAEEYRQSGDVEFILIAFPGEGDDSSVDEFRSEVRTVMQGARSNLPIYHDESNASIYATMEAGHMNGFPFPTTFIIDRTGKIRALWEGTSEVAVSEMKAVIHEALADPKGAAAKP